MLWVKVGEFVGRAKARTCQLSDGLNLVIVADLAVRNVIRCQDLSAIRAKFTWHGPMRHATYGGGNCLQISSPVMLTGIVRS